MARLLAPFLLSLLLAPASTLASASFEPEGALPFLEYSYTPKGEFGSIDDLPIYVAEQPDNPEPGRFVVWGYDISGWGNPPSAGRAFDMVDQLSELTGMTVIFPDFYRGEQYPPIESYRWETELQVTLSLSCLIYWLSSSLFQYDWYDRLRPYLDERNATAVGMVGTCWGSYLVTHVAAEDPIVKAGFSIHPSHVALMARLDESETAIYEGIQENGSAQYFGNTPSETNNTASGGLADSIIDQVLKRMLCTRLS